MTYRDVDADSVDQPILRHTGTATTLPTTGDNALCNHRNQQYSIIGLTNAAGTLVERYSYSAYGTLGIYDPSGTVRTTSTYANRYTYTGREYEPDLNLYHFRARWYDPATGGFISRDPLGYVDGMSLYRGYFGVRGLDSTGLCNRKICGPDVTTWFQRQLDIIKEYSHQRWTAFIWYDPFAIKQYYNFWKTLKFIENPVLLVTGGCPVDCPNSVTLCGRCYNVTELGNLAYGYGASDIVGRMLWGGILAEVRGNGFDKDADLLAALVGTQLNTGDICERINSVAPFSKFDAINLQIGFWIRDAKSMNRWAWIRYGDVIQKWEDKTGLDFEKYVLDNFKKLKEKSLHETAGVDCEPCNLTVNPSDILISEDGTVSW